MAASALVDDPTASFERDTRVQDAGMPLEPLRVAAGPETAPESAASTPSSSPRLPRSSPAARRGGAAATGRIPAMTPRPSAPRPPSALPASSASPTSSSSSSSSSSSTESEVARRRRGVVCNLVSSFIEDANLDSAASFLRDEDAGVRSFTREALHSLGSSTRSLRDRVLAAVTPLQTTSEEAAELTASLSAVDVPEDE